MDRAFTERYAEMAESHWWFRGRRRVLDAVLDRALPPATRRLAAIGCGPDDLAWLSRRGYVVGADPEPIFSSAAPRGRLVRASAEALPFPSRAFEAVCAFDVLEHLDDDVGALREMARIAAPGGTLVVTVPALPSLWGPHDVVNGHRRRYTRRTLRAALERAGIAGARIHYFNALLFPPIAAVRWTRRLAGGGGPARSDFEGPALGASAASALAGIFGLERHLVGRVPFPVGVSLVSWTRLA